MATRPVFIPDIHAKSLVKVRLVDFKWFPGMSATQRKKSVVSLHNSAKEVLNFKDILEVSTKSESDAGIALSAFNLSFTTLGQNRTFTVECAYQASKVFENGGPYIDLLEKNAGDAKRDERLKKSGRLIGFQFFKTSWGLEPKAAFYNWLYINALRKQVDLHRAIETHEAFTDIEFNPEKSFSCQAYSVALFSSLTRKGILEEVVSTKEAFIEAISNFGSDNDLFRTTITK
ncbi:hypothetical protein ROTAS13_04417 [Roseomonas sp. TAS13]|uniref:DarT1-associated NADAR antitoxin family protein n=1 Tax=Roseomonas sp. TAS13 TaxID=1926319 RepID=UPI000965D0E4|nr:hypothetical protein NF552_05045 [Roseomonas mucosa]GAV36729.1 hypothetical protein ROTAS13_04417 [Roseomonas sp. TAS13]